MQLLQRRPDLAARTLLDVRHDRGLVASRRVHHNLTRIRTLWRPYRTQPIVQQADDVITQLLATRKAAAT